MKKDQSIVLFKQKQIRRNWNSKKELWYFSVIDIISLLTEQADYKKAKTYWTTLKNRLKNEGSEVVTKCDRLKMMAMDGKMRETDIADVKTLLRLIQSVPSKKAEPIKLWLAKVGYERIQETTDPEKSINRARTNWQSMGRNKKWIQQRMMGQEVRNKLTDYWKDNEVRKKQEYAILTNIIHKEWSDLSIREHKNLKELKRENLRDHMTDAELVFTTLAELSTRQIAESMKTKGFNKNKIPAKKGGKVAKNARIELEQKTGKKIITKNNYKLPENNRKKLK